LLIACMAGAFGGCHQQAMASARLGELAAGAVLQPVEWQTIAQQQQQQRCPATAGGAAVATAAAPPLRRLSFRLADTPLAPCSDSDSEEEAARAAAAAATVGWVSVTASDGTVLVQARAAEPAALTSPGALAGVGGDDEGGGDGGDGGVSDAGDISGSGGDVSEPDPRHRADQSAMSAQEQSRGQQARRRQELSVAPVLAEAEMAEPGTGTSVGAVGAGEPGGGRGSTEQKEKKEKQEKGKKSKHRSSKKHHHRRRHEGRPDPDGRSGGSVDDLSLGELRQASCYHLGSGAGSLGHGGASRTWGGGGGGDGRGLRTVVIPRRDGGFGMVFDGAGVLTGWGQRGGEASPAAAAGIPLQSRIVGVMGVRGLSHLVLVDWDFP
jgi:hypothetical protein